MRSSRPRPRTSAPSTRSGSRRTRSSRRRWPRWAARPTTRPPPGLARAWSSRRPSASFWLRDDPARQSAWQLVRDAARLGQAIARAGTRIGVDTQRRRGRRGCHERPMPSAAPPSIRRTGSWSSGGRLCSTRCSPSSRPCGRASTGCAVPGAGGPMPGRVSSTRSARHAASCRVPGTSSGRSSTRWSGRWPQEPGTTAYFVVDALRFEMGEELFRQMEGTPATTVTLRPRLAELPTVTEVGMNVLAPVVAQRPAADLDGGRRRRGPGLPDGRVPGFRSRDAQAGHARPGRRRDLPVAHP